MRRRDYVLICALLVFVWSIAGVGTSPTAAQGGPTGTAISNLNVRSGPGEEHPIVTVIPRRSAVTIEARNRWGDWVLVSTADGSARGWVATRYLILPGDFDIAAIPQAEGQTGQVAQAGSSPDQVAAAPVGSGNAGLPAQEPNAWTIQELNLRQGPELTFETITRLPSNTGLVLEGRNPNGLWALVHTADGQYRGWIAANFLRLAEGESIDWLPVTDGSAPPPAPLVVATAAPTAVAAAPAASAPNAAVPAANNPPSAAPAAAYVPTNADEAALIAQLSAVPVLPAISANAHVIFQRGQALGNNPRMFAKVGDCNSESRGFMALIGMGQYQLGAYPDLQQTIDFFAAGSPNPFMQESAAGRSGYTASSVVDPLWGDPRLCQSGESPLECEYRRLRPAVSLIMFGANDVHNLTAEAFQAGMRRIVTLSLERGVIPVLTTYPSDPAENSKWMDVLRFNVIVVNLAREYDVPVVNLWLAARGLPHNGVENDFLHLSYNHNAWITFNGDETQWGMTLWNLTMLQTLDALRENALGG